MKSILFVAAACFAFVTPAAAQPAQPQADAHAQHQIHGQHDGHTAHAQHQNGQHPDGHAAHQANGECCADKNGNGKMDCCDGAQAADRPCCAEHAEGAAHAPVAEAPSHD